LVCVGWGAKVENEFVGLTLHSDWLGCQTFPIRLIQSIYIFEIRNPLAAISTSWLLQFVLGFP
jgi:hypothetical protein